MTSASNRLAWRAFTEKLDALSDAEVCPNEHDLTGWPDHLRTTPGRWLKRLLDGEDEPRLEFVRTLDHVLFAEPPRRARLAWANTPRLSDLTTLRLYDETIGDDGPRAFAHSAHLRSLNDLALSTNMTSKGAAALVAGPCASIRVLSLQRNRIDATGIARLGALTSLEALHLGRNGLDDAGLDALVKWPSLQRLDLDLNAFTDAGLERLCASGKLAGLHELNLSNNSIGLRGCRALASCADLAGLERLFLHNCGLTDEATAALLVSPHLRSLGNLALSENRLGWASVDALATTPMLSTLYELNVCHNAFEPEEASAHLRRSPHLTAVRRFCT